MTPPRLSVWPPLAPTTYWRPQQVRLPFPLEDPRCRLFSKARHGLHHALAKLGLGPGDEFLVPAYHHGSEIEVLTRAGIRCSFYDLDDHLRPRPDELESLISEGRTKALYLVHYLGWPQDAVYWREWCDRHSLLLFEDAAQAWLASFQGRPLGSWGDVSFFCLYKTFGLPDGAALLSVAPPGNDGPNDQSSSMGPVLKKHAAWLESRFSLASTAAASVRNDGAYDYRTDFELGDPNSSPAKSTLSLLARVASTRAIGGRRANYLTLLDQLGDLVPRPWNDLVPGAVPFAFPIAVDNKSALLGRLAEHGVAGLDLWSAAHPVVEDVDGFKVSSRRRTIVGLPVHQELRPSDLDRIVAAVRKSPSTSRLIVREVDADDVRADWDRLAIASRNIFSTWEWADVWRRHFLGGREVSFHALSDAGGKRIAILPLYLWSGARFKVARLLGHGPADQLAPVCAENDLPRAARALRQVLQTSSWKVDGFLGDYLPSDQSWTSMLGARVLRRFESPILKFDGDWEAYLASRSSNLREQIRRRERVLMREHAVGYRLAADPQRLEQDLDVLFSLYDARWPEGERAFSAAQGFHREFARLAMERGWLRLWFLELEGRAVAAWYGFRYGGVESYYQAGRDPVAADDSVGFVLLTHTMREALNDGVREYRFLRGGESYKYRFATEDPGVETVAVGRGPGSRALLGLASMAGGWKPARKALKRFII